MGKNKLSYLRCVGVRRTLPRIENGRCNSSMVGHKVFTEASAIEISSICTKVERDRRRE
jgi:hypothetical protein